VTSPWDSVTAIDATKVLERASLLNYHHHPSIAGNAPGYVKQLNYNTYTCYGIGEVNVKWKFGWKERLEGITGDYYDRGNFEVARRK